MPLTTSSLLNVLTDIDSYLVDEFYKPKDKSNLKGSLLNRPSSFFDMSEDQFKIQILVPGHSKEQLKVEPNGDKITVSAVVPEEEKKSYVKNFKLDFYAPSGKWDHANVDASLENGVLTINLFQKDKKETHAVVIK